MMGRTWREATARESESAIEAFAGEEIGRAVFYPEDARFRQPAGMTA